MTSQRLTADQNAARKADGKFGHTRNATDGDTAADRANTLGDGSSGYWVRTSPPLATVQFQGERSQVEGFVRGSMRDEYDLSAPYQRDSVWEPERQRNFIRSLLIGVPTGTVIVATQDHGKANGYYRVVDGKQRIEAMQAFHDGELAVPADWFPDRDLDPSIVGDDGMVTYDQLTDLGQRDFRRRTINVSTFDSQSETTDVGKGKGNSGSSDSYVVTDRTPEEALAYEAEVFGLINTGGVDQTDESIANAARFADGNGPTEWEADDFTSWGKPNRP